MTVSDAYVTWSTAAASNSPAGSATPEIDDEFRNIKAQVKTNAVTLTGNQTIAGIKTFSSIPVLPGTDCASDNESARKAYVDAAVSSGLTGLISSGTKMLFAQAAAPTGWTQDTSINDKVLRLVDNTGTGGSTGGSWTISGISLDTHVLTIDEIPAHVHNVIEPNQLVWSTYTDTLTWQTISSAWWFIGITTFVSESAGGGLGHNHNLTIGNTWRPAYLDIIAATRN